MRNRIAMLVNVVILLGVIFTIIGIWAGIATPRFVLTVYLFVLAVMVADNIDRISYKMKLQRRRREIDRQLTTYEELHDKEQ